MELINTIATNGFVLFIPILLWNVFLVKYLPPAYGATSFNAGIPKLISIGERIGRVCIFGLPLMMKLNFSTSSGKLGLLLFASGVVIYFSSWLALIAAPGSKWSKSMIGFTAPAYTIIIWLIGFALIADTFYFNKNDSIRYFLIPAIFMTVFHTAHAVFVWLREYRPLK